MQTSCDVRLEEMPWPLVPEGHYALPATAVPISPRTASPASHRTASQNTLGEQSKPRLRVFICAKGSASLAQLCDAAVVEELSEAELPRAAKACGPGDQLVICLTELGPELEAALAAALPASADVLVLSDSARADLGSPAWAGLRAVLISGAAMDALPRSAASVGAAFNRMQGDLAIQATRGVSPFQMPWPLNSSAPDSSSTSTLCPSPCSAEAARRDSRDTVVMDSEEVVSATRADSGDTTALDPEEVPADIIEGAARGILVTRCTPVPSSSAPLSPVPEAPTPLEPPAELPTLLVGHFAHSPKRDCREPSSDAGSSCDVGSFGEIESAGEAGCRGKGKRAWLRRQVGKLRRTSSK